MSLLPKFPQTQPTWILEEVEQVGMRQYRLNQFLRLLKENLNRPSKDYNSLKIIEGVI
jgi:hypothetical protein